MLRNLILDTDSYKASHFLQYPSDMQGMFSYLESRGGEYPKTLFFGLQYLLVDSICQRVDMAHVFDAEHFYGWMR